MERGWTPTQPAPRTPSPDALIDEVLLRGGNDGSAPSSPLPQPPDAQGDPYDQSYSDESSLSADDGSPGPAALDSYIVAIPIDMIANMEPYLERAIDPMLTRGHVAVEVYGPFARARPPSSFYVRYMFDLTADNGLRYRAITPDGEPIPGEPSGIDGGPNPAARAARIVTRAWSRAVTPARIPMALFLPRIWACRALGIRAGPAFSLCPYQYAGPGVLHARMVAMGSAAAGARAPGQPSEIAYAMGAPRGTAGTLRIDAIMSYDDDDDESDTRVSLHASADVILNGRGRIMSVWTRSPAPEGRPSAALRRGGDEHAVLRWYDECVGTLRRAARLRAASFESTFYFPERVPSPAPIVRSTAPLSIAYSVDPAADRLFAVMPRRADVRMEPFAAFHERTVRRVLGMSATARRPPDDARAPRVVARRTRWHPDGSFVDDDPVR